MEAVNFSAGPAAMPEQVLARTREALAEPVPLCTRSHRSPEFQAVFERVRTRLRRLLGLGEGFEVFLLQGGATQMFATVPLNFLQEGQAADYVMTGPWSDKALAEALIIGAASGGEVRAISSGKTEAGYAFIPTDDELGADPEASYVHITTNNTIVGSQFHRTPRIEAPLVADMSSDILSRPLVDPDRFGVIYAGAQKNIGPAGLTVACVRRDMLQRPSPGPKILSFAQWAQSPMLNTPPSLSVQMADFVLEWLEDEGGVEEMARRNEAKQAALYRVIDADPDFYRTVVWPRDRSWMNVTFRLPTFDLEAALITEAESAGLFGLKGHRSVGGLRVSLYNAVPLEGVHRLIELMESFRRRHRS
ncbi:MAG: 3-phosphoserine/phosphohydroxythreonine transaminase [Myxococcota bacterium]